MPYESGERLRCNDCGAEILYVKPCTCPQQDPKAHSNLCCGQEMQRLGILEKGQTAPQPPAH